MASPGNPEGLEPIQSGSYFYKLVTDKGESPAQRIVWMK